MNSDENNTPDQPSTHTAFDACDKETRLGTGELVAQPMTQTERTKARIERGVSFLSHASQVLVHGEKRANEIRAVMGDEYGMDL